MQLDVLYDADVSHEIAGAALDVTEVEPLPPEHKIWDAPGVFITPHTAGGFHLDLTLDKVVDIAEANLRHYLNHEPLINLVDIRRGYEWKMNRTGRA